METWDAIRSRRDVREYEPTPIDDAALRRILEAGRRSPSSRNWQPWTFAVVTDRSRLEQLSKVWRGGGHVAHSAATIGLVAEEPAPEAIGRLQFDLGQAAMSMMLAATDSGIASGHSAVEDQDLARSVLELTSDQIAAASTTSSIGCQHDARRDRSRRLSLRPWIVGSG